MPTLNLGTLCCQIVANPALGSHLGQLVVAFPEGADAGGTEITVYKADAQTKVQGGWGNQHWELWPGTYAVEINGIRVSGVTVQAGHETRVRVGTLRVKAGGGTEVDVLDTGGKKIKGNWGTFALGLPPGSYKVQIAGESQAVTVREGQITNF
jgi:hypothetical protein